MVKCVFFKVVDWFGEGLGEEKVSVVVFDYFVVGDDKVFEVVVLEEVDGLLDGLVGGDVGVDVDFVVCLDGYVVVWFEDVGG